jgi:hypothetical protein
LVVNFLATKDLDPVPIRLSENPLLKK